MRLSPEVRNDTRSGERNCYGGIPAKLIDTAGIRKALDEAESIGIRKSMEALADADIVLFVLDATEALHEEDKALLEQIEQRRAIVVENKADLAGSARVDGSNGVPRVRTSALTGEGVAELRTEILREISGDAGVQPKLLFSPTCAKRDWSRTR